MRTGAPVGDLPLCLTAHDDDISRNEEHHGGDPRDGVGGANAGKSPDAHEHERRENAPRQLRDARKRRDRALADALQRVAENEDRAEEGIERALPQQILPAVADDRVVIVRNVRAQIGIEKELHERFAQPDGEGEPDDRARQHVDHAHKDAAADAPVLPRAVVLGGIGGERRSERGKRLIGDVIDLRRGGVRRDRPGIGGVQPVERGLLHDAADGGDGELQRHGQPDGKMPHREAGIPSEIRPSWTERGIAAERIDKARRARNELREHGGDRRAAVMPSESDDKGEIQPHIQDRGKDEKDERRARIADGAEKSRHNVIKYRRADPAENDEQVPIRVIVVGGGRLHQAKQGRGERRGDRRRRRGNDNAQKIAHAHSAAHLLLVVRAERLRDLDGESRRQPVDEPEDEKVDRPRQPDARKRRRADGIADDDGIRHIIKLLEHAADKHGKREK